MDELNNDQLRNLIKELAWNDDYGCFTRAGFEKVVWDQIAHKARWLIFFDVDFMHELNDRHGYDGVNAIIKKSLPLRESDFKAGQWFSGDEFIVCITDDDPSRDVSNPMEFAIRLAEIFRANGAPATGTPDLSGAWARLTFGFEPPASGLGPIGRDSNQPNQGGKFHHPNLKPAAAANV